MTTIHTKYGVFKSKPDSNFSRKKADAATVVEGNAIAFRLLTERGEVFIPEALLKDCVITVEEA